MRVVMSVLAVAVVAGCASSGRRPAGRDPDLIRFEEIEPLRVGTAYEVVEQLRPEFLRTRGQSSFTMMPAEAIVYLDGNRLGPPSTLRGISKETLREIRYLDSRDATTRFGTNHRGGAILVVTR